MNTKHRWYDVIVAWANGEEVQFRVVNIDQEWVDYEAVAHHWTPEFNTGHYEWRIKPDIATKRYRMALVNMYGGIKIKEPYVVAINVSHFSIDDPAEYNTQGFIRWVGEPVEVEIEV